MNFFFKKTSHFHFRSFVCTIWIFPFLAYVNANKLQCISILSRNNIFSHSLFMITFFLAFCMFVCLRHGDLFKLLFIKCESFLVPAWQKPHVLCAYQDKERMRKREEGRSNDTNTFRCIRCMKVHFAAFNKLIYAKLFISFM